MPSPEELKSIHKPAEILQDAAGYLASSINKSETIQPIVAAYATEINGIAKGKVVDLSVQFRDDDGNPLEPQHVGTAQFEEWSRDEQKKRWLGRFKSINAGGFNEWPTEGTVIPLGADCLILKDVEQG